MGWSCVNCRLFSIVGVVIVVVLGLARLTGRRSLQSVRCWRLALSGAGVWTEVQPIVKRRVFGLNL